MYHQVYLHLYGTEANWTSVNLNARKNTKSTDGFPTGSTRTFCLKGPDIGQLNQLNVNVNSVEVFSIPYVCLSSS
jgi:hypothetical protein